VHYLTNSLWVHNSQPIEEFHSLVSEKGHQLGKPERDIISKFIQGLPDQLAFFVRASRTTSYRDALHSAKIGEAHGYRTVHYSSFAYAKNDLVTNALHVPAAPSSNNGQSKPRPRTPRGSCYKCLGRGHFQNTCNWNGFDKADGEIQCQLCDQNGHNAKCCIKNPCAKRTTNSSSTCQLCGIDGHTAKQCEQLHSGN
jgi:hypothetical protein